MIRRRATTAVTLSVLFVVLCGMAVIGFRAATAPLPGSSGSSDPTCSETEQDVKAFIARSEVQVSVFNAGSFLYRPEANVQQYLQVAGGPTRGADFGSTFVIRANGSVISGRQRRGWLGRSTGFDDLRAEAGDGLRHLAVVRYDAFGDMGGHLSWSLALLDDRGDGVVVSSIHGRSEARTYAKNIATWSCDQAMSPEEEEAVKFARAG